MMTVERPRRSRFGDAVARDLDRIAFTVARTPAGRSACRAFATARLPRGGRRRRRPAATARPCSFRRSASLPACVVLPEPCRPTIMITDGGASENCRRACAPPSSATSSSWTILTIVCAGVSDSRTSAPSAFSLIRATNALAAPSETSASSSATRTSRSASLTSLSLRRPRPLSREKIAPKRSAELIEQ